MLFSNDAHKPLSFIITQKIVVSLIVTITIFSVATPCAHAIGPIVINEFQTASPQSIELLNVSDTNTVSLQNWYLDDQGSAVVYSITTNILLAPHQCVVFQADFDLNTSTADSVRLFQPGAVLQDNYAYARGPSTGMTYARIPHGNGTFVERPPTLGNDNDTGVSCTTLPTPTTTVAVPPTPTMSPTATTVPFTPTPSATATPLASPSITPSGTPIPTITPVPTHTATPLPTPTASPTPFALRIVEFMPYPSSGPEWVELYNDGPTELTLIGWFIDDTPESGQSPFPISLTIPPATFAVVELTNSMLNNDSDSVRLLDPSGQAVDSVSYTSTSVGLSWGHTTTSLLFCLQYPSKNAPNNPCITPSAPPTKTPTLTKIPTPPVTPTPTTTTSTASSIYLYELFMVTDSTHPVEWIELYNDNAYSVTIEDWFLGDSADPTAQTISATLEAYRTTAIDMSTTRLNNTGDTVYLSRPDSTVVDSISYDDSSLNGVSYGRSNKSFHTWCWQSPTKDALNADCVSEPTSTPTKTLTPTRTPSPTRTPTATRTPTPIQRATTKAGTIATTPTLIRDGARVLGAAATQRTAIAMEYTPRATDEQATLTRSPTPPIDSEDVDDATVSGLSEQNIPSILYIIALIVSASIGGYCAYQLWLLYQEHSVSILED